METLHFSIRINAPKEKVWHAMLDDAGYRQWTSAFCEGSYYKGNWEAGSKILFLSPDGEGMVSRVAENIPYRYISLEHVGLVSKEGEDTESEAAKVFSGAHENYTFGEKDGYTEVLVAVDTTEAHKAMFEATWPKALARLKDLSEKVNT